MRIVDEDWIEIARAEWTSCEDPTKRSTHYLVYEASIRVRQHKTEKGSIIVYATYDSCPTDGESDTHLRGGYFVTVPPKGFWQKVVAAIKQVAMNISIRIPESHGAKTPSFVRNLAEVCVGRLPPQDVTDLTNLEENDVLVKSGEPARVQPESNQEEIELEEEIDRKSRSFGRDCATRFIELNPEIKMTGHDFSISSGELQKVLNPGVELDQLKVTAGFCSQLEIWIKWGGGRSLGISCGGVELTRKLVEALSSQENKNQTSEEKSNV
jgi:hypothetical protein